MNSYSLSVYRITIYNSHKKDELLNLSNFDNGKNFIKLVNDMFLTWRNEAITMVVKDDNARKVSRLKRDSSNNWIYHCHTTYIDGIIESGNFGTQENIIDIETGDSKYIKLPKDAALVPFYFMIYILPNSNEGYLILERIMGLGIYSIIDKAIKTYIGSQVDGKYTLKIEPYIVPELLKLNLQAVGGAKRVTLKGVNINQFKSMSLSQDYQGCTTEVSFIAPRNTYINDLFDLFKSNKSKDGNNLYRVNNIECTDVSFDLNINGNKRKVYVANITNIGMNMDITKRIEVDGTGYPSYSCISKEANEIISYIIKEIN